MAINLANNNSLANITALPSSVSGGGMTLLATQTASGSANLSFTSGIDDTYDSYVFKLINIHPATNSADFSFQADTGTNTNYNIAVTSSGFEAYQNEAGNSAALRYDAQYDNPNSTGFVQISSELQNDSDSSGSGELVFYNPSSDTFVKHWTSTSNNMRFDVHCYQYHKAGYFNTTTALTRVQFKINANTFDGTIKMYGIK